MKMKFLQIIFSAGALALCLIFPMSCETTKDSTKGADKFADKTDAQIIGEKDAAEKEKENKFYRKALRAADLSSDSMTNEVVAVSETPIDSVKEIEDFNEEKRKTEKGQAGAGIEKKSFYEKFLEGKEDQPEAVTLNFDAVSLNEVVQYFSDTLEFKYIFDPRVKPNNVTLMLGEMQLTKRQMWQLFEQVLWLSGAYCSPGVGNIINIYPFLLMPQEQNALGGKEPAANVIVRLVTLKYATTKDILDKIQPFMTEGAKAIEVPTQNGILIIETPANFGKIEELISLLDKKGRADWPQVVISCSNISAANVKEELASILPVLGFPIALDNAVADPGAIHLISVDRLQVILASAANDEALGELRKWVSILDRSDIGEQERVFVYKVINGTASELYNSISTIFNTSGSTAAAGGTGGGSALATSKPVVSNFQNNRTSQNQQKTPELPKPPTAKPTTASSGAGGQGTGKQSSSIFEVPAKIFADDVHNRLIIRTTPRTYAMIKALLSRLDTVPAQVLLQVMIAEITLTESTQFGLEFSGRVRNKFMDTAYGTDYAGLVPGGKDQTGFRYWVQNPRDPENKFAYIRALAGTDNTRVLSSPQIVAVSHTAAEIKVGDKVPMLDKVNTNTSSGSELSYSIQYQDTGIILQITPHVTEGGLIVMDVDQTVSDAVKTTSSTINSPTIQERHLKTSLAIRDGGTLIVGGLISDRNAISQSSVPFLSKIPLLASLAGYNDIERKKVELLVMITGTVITEKTDLELMTRRYEESMKILRDSEKDKNE